MSKDVYVFIEQRDNQLQKVGIELLGKARELADDLGQQVVAMLLGDNVKQHAELLIHHGADKVIVIEDPMLKEYVTEPYAKAVAHIIKKYDPEIALYGASSIGRDLAPRLAARIHTGLTADCTGLEIDEESKNLLMTRPAFGGNLMATILCEDFRPQMATVRPGVMQALQTDTSRKGEVIEEKVDFEPKDMNVKIVDIVKSESKKKDITEAAILVSAGMGVKDEEGLKVVKDFAKALGAEFGVTKPIVDNGWADKSLQVGVTGKTVKPKLYIAVGISGALQHTNGMKESELIIAINSDKDAKIMKIANYGIVGDLFKILPLLSERIREERKVN